MDYWYKIEFQKQGLFQAAPTTDVVFYKDSDSGVISEEGFRLLLIKNEFVMTHDFYTRTRVAPRWQDETIQKPYAIQSCHGLLRLLFNHKDL